MFHLFWLLEHVLLFQMWGLLDHVGLIRRRQYCVYISCSWRSYYRDSIGIVVVDRPCAFGCSLHFYVRSFTERRSSKQNVLTVGLVLFQKLRELFFRSWLFGSFDDGLGRGKVGEFEGVVRFGS